MVKLEIKDRFQLLALHRVIMEAKFHKDPDDKDILASPLVAELANNVFKELRKAFPEDKALETAEWDKWQPLEQHEAIIELVKGILSKDDNWLRAKDKEKFVRDSFSPFTMSDEFIQEFIKEVNENHAT